MNCKKEVRILISLLLCVFLITGCASAGTGAAAEQTTAEPATVEQAASEQTAVDQAAEPAAAEQEACSYQEYPLERNGISLHLDCMKLEDTAPTLVICGDKDPYLNYDAVNASPERLPEGSELKVIRGGSHILLYEKNCYKEFQDDVVRFLLGN